MENEVKKVEEQKPEVVQQVPKQKTIKKEKKSSKKKINPLTIIAIFLIILSMGMLGSGIYFMYLSNPKKIVSSGIEEMTASFKNVLLTSNKNLNLGENFTIESDITIDAQSDLLATQNQEDTILTEQQTDNQLMQPEATIDPVNGLTTNMDMYNKLITNIANTQNKVVLKQDKTNKKAFFSIDSTYNDENLISAKYLIENSTEYYFVDGFLDNYVNNGSSNYFEAITEQTNNQDNIIYIYDLISNSLKENLKEEYFIKEQEKTKIFNEEKNMTKVILKIDNKKAKDILKAIIKDLKADKKANDILTNYYEDFSKLKIKDDATIFEDGEYITINSYANNLKYDIQKVEIIYVSKEEQTKIIYETNENNSKISLFENDKCLGYVEINKINDNKYVSVIKDSSGAELGSIKAEKTNNQTKVELDTSNEGSRIYVSYNSKATDIKDKSFKLKDEITFKVLSDNTNVISATIKINSNVSKTVEIEEDISTSVLASTLTEEDKLTLEQVFTNALLKLSN